MNRNTAPKTLASEHGSRKIVDLRTGEPPADPPPARRKKAVAPEFLQEDEVQRLFGAIKSIRDRAIFRLLYHAGLRASEIALLDMRDYDPRTERLTVSRLKGSHSGVHHLVREATKALRPWLRERGNAPGPMFPSRKRGPISRFMIFLLMRKYGELAGIPVKLRHPHILKHSCATHLLSKGYNIEQVQDWLGHVNIQNTLVYARITNARREEMGTKLRDSWK